MYNCNPFVNRHYKWAWLAIGSSRISPWARPGTICTGGWVGLGAAFQFADRPACSESLHQVRFALPTTAKAEEVAVSGKV